MKTRKLVRRSLFTAALSTASILSLPADVFGLDTIPTDSKIQVVQFVPPKAQNATQPATSVEQELKRMFAESGQPMPSMRPQDLPNANVVPPSQMQPRPGMTPQQNAGAQNRAVQQNPAQMRTMQNGAPQNGVPQKTAAATSPPKRNFLQKFMGKVTGKDQKSAEAAVIPPVPPGSQEPAPAPPADAPTAVARNSANQNSNAGNRVPAQNVSRPATSPQSGQMQNGQMRNAQQFRTAQNSTTRPTQQPVPNGSRASVNGQMSQVPPVPTAANGPSQPVPAVPFRRPANSPVSQPVTRSQSTPKATVSAQPAIEAASRYVQPGTAPAFMPDSQVARPGVTVEPQVAVSGSEVPQQQPVVGEQLPSLDDGFELPFIDSDDSNDILDLDALNLPIADAPVSSQNVISQSVEQPVLLIPSPAQAVPVDRLQNVVVPSTRNSSEFGIDFSESPQVLPVPQDFAEPAEPVELNPFTGVRIDDTELGFSGKVALPPVTLETSDDLPFGEAVPPMEEFGTNLPAIQLPSIDEEPSVVTGGSVLPIPNLEEAPVFSGTPVTSSTTGMNDARTMTPNQGLDVTEAAPARSVDSERLQQVAEQERMLRQQRQIQSRAGVPGFKGFCPVTLRDKRELADTSPEYTAVFGLQTYQFASPQARAAFESDPSRYAPAAGGSDVVLLVNTGEEEQGMLDYALWYRDRLYMFRSRETMTAFNKNPQRFANQY